MGTDTSHRIELPIGLTEEVRLSFRFIRRDLSATMVPSFIVLLAACRHAPALTAREVTLAIARWAVYFWLYIYTFCLLSQSTGIEEDRLNKPDRPIPMGLVSPRGAMARWVLLMLAFSIAGWWFGLLKWTLLWQALMILYSLGGLDKHWFTKNVVFISLGTIAQIAPAWELIEPLTLSLWRWVVGVSVIVGVTVLVQDFRDAAGDRAAGRRTLSDALGGALARIVTSLSLAAAPIILHFALLPSWSAPSAIACSAALALFAGVIVVRLLTRRTPKDDHNTYMLWTYWFCSILGSGIVTL